MKSIDIVYCIFLNRYPGKELVAIVRDKTVAKKTTAALELVNPDPGETDYSFEHAYVR